MTYPPRHTPPVPVAEPARDRERRTTPPARTGTQRIGGALRHPTAGRARADAVRSVQRGRGNTAAGALIDGEPTDAFFGAETDLPATPVVTTTEPESGVAGGPPPPPSEPALAAAAATASAVAAAPAAAAAMVPAALDALTAAPAEPGTRLVHAEADGEPADAFFGAETEAPAAAAGPGAAPAEGAAEAATGGPPPPAHGEPTTAEQWRTGVRQAANALPQPRVAAGGGGTRAMGAVADAAGKRGEQDRKEVSATTARHVPPKPREPEPPKPPPDPVPDATKKVREAVAKVLEPLTLPVLQVTPVKKTIPVLPPPVPAPPPKEEEPAKTAAGTGKKPPPSAKTVPAKEEPKVEPAPKDAPAPPPVVKDVRVPIGEPLPPHIAIRIGNVVGELTADIENIVKETLTTARRNSYRGGKLVDAFPDLDKDEKPELTKAMTEQLHQIGEFAGLGKEDVDRAVTERTEALNASKTQAAQVQQEAADDAEKKVKEEERKTATAISKARVKTAKEYAERMKKAMTSTNPQFITDVQDELIGKHRVDITRGAASQRRAGVKRGDELAKYEEKYTQAYREADNKDIESSGRGITNVNMDPSGVPWLDARLKEVARYFKDEKKKATDQAEELAKSTETAGLDAYELVREWAAERLGQLRDDDTKRREKFHDADAQARRRTIAEAEVKAQEARDALVTDILLLDALATAETATTDTKAAEQAQQLDAEQVKGLKTYFGVEIVPKDPVKTLARTTRARLMGERQEALIKKLREAVEKMDPFSLDDKELEQLAAVLWQGDGGAAVQIANKLNAAMEPVGTEEDDIYKALAGLTPTQARVVRAVYKSRFKHTLEWALRDEMSGSELDRALALAKGDKVAGAASAIYDAIIGPGTNEKLVYATMRDLSPEELEEVKKYYHRVYKESLDDALKGDFSDRELARAQALAAGDKDKADAYGLDEAARGSVWGPDYKEMGAIHKQIRDDVGKANPAMKTVDLDKEIRRRTAGVESSYEKYPGAGTTLKEMYSKQLKGPTKDFAVALVDNDLDGADAALFKIEADLAQQEGRTADDQFNDIVKARHERMADKVRRDEAPAMHLKLAKEIADRDKSANPMLPWEREKRERELQVEINELAQQRSKEGMGTLQTRFDEKYIGTYSRYDPNTGVLAQERGGFAAMAKMLASGEESKAYLAKGHLTLAEEIRFSVQGAGTNEDRLKSTTKGRTKKEIQDARAEYKLKWKEDMDDRIKSELDEGTRDYFDIVEENMQGVPETPEAMMEAARKRYKFETTTYGAGGAFELAPEKRALLDKDYNEMRARFAKLGDPAHRPPKEELEKLYTSYSWSSENFKSTADLYRTSVDALVDVLTQVIGAVVAITVAVVLTIATAGTAAPAMIALAASLWGTAATITTKMVLLGRAYGLEDLGKDLALGAVDAVVSVATAGMGDKLLKAAKGAASPGVLARMAASGSRAAKIGARAAAEVVEQAAQAGPNALAATLLDDNTYRGDVFKNIIKGTAQGTAMGMGIGLGMGSVMRLGGKVVGGLHAEYRAMRGMPPPDAVASVASAQTRAAERAGQPGRPADVLELRGNASERHAAWQDFKRRYPGATMKEFVKALDNGLEAIQTGADVRHQVQRRMRGELLEALPPDLKKTFAKTPIEVMSDADFEAFTRSRTKSAVVTFENGQPRVIVREGAPPGALREEGVHLWQSVDPRTAPKVAKLDETRLRGWDSTMTIGEKVDAYRTKIELEIDGQHRTIAHLEGLRNRPDLHPSARIEIEAHLAAARQTLDNLKVRQGEVGDLGPDVLAKISRGEMRQPQYLDQPARLFSAATETPRVTPVKDSPEHGRGKQAYRVGDSWTETKKGGIKRRYRTVMVVDENGTVAFREEILDVDRKWVRRGSDSTSAGELMEEASRIHTATRKIPDELAKGNRLFPMNVQTRSGKGFDEVVIVFNKDGTVRVALVEVKDYPDRYVPLADLTAIDENIRKNLIHVEKTLRNLMDDPLQTSGMTRAELAQALKAVRDRQLDVEIRLGPTTHMGDKDTGTILNTLEADLRRRYRHGDVRVAHAPVHIDPADVKTAQKNLEALGERAGLTREERIAALAVAPGGASHASVREAHAAYIAESLKTPVLDSPVRRGPGGVGLFDSQGRPLEVFRPGRPRGDFDPDKLAAEVFNKLRARAPNEVKPLVYEPMRVVLDTGELTNAQARLLAAALDRLALAQSARGVLDTQLVTVSVGK